MSERRWLAELDEHDRDLYEAELAYDRWLQGLRDDRADDSEPTDHEKALYYGATGDLRGADGYDPRDPGDRLRVEGGEL